MIAARRPFSPAILQELRERSSSRERAERAVGAIGDNVSLQIDEVIARLEAASKGAEDYGHTLSAARGELGDMHSPDSLRKLVGNLISATKEMESRTHTLEKELHVSSQQVSDLKTSSRACARKA